MRARVLPHKHLWVCVRFLFCFIPNARGKRGELGRQLLMPIHQFKWIRNSWRIFAQKICLHRNVFCINMNLIWHFSVREIVSIVIGWNCQIKQRLIAKLIPFGNLTKTSCKRGHKGKQRLFFAVAQMISQKTSKCLWFWISIQFQTEMCFPKLLTKHFRILFPWNWFIQALVLDTGAFVRKQLFLQYIFFLLLSSFASYCIVVVVLYISMPKSIPTS